LWDVLPDAVAAVAAAGMAAVAVVLMADLPELVERRLREVQAELHAADALTRLSPELQVLLELEELVAV
jgi:hypothetical protein